MGMKKSRFVSEMIQDRAIRTMAVRSYMVYRTAQFSMTLNNP